MVPRKMKISSDYAGIEPLLSRIIATIMRITNLPKIKMMKLEEL
jgi:hypothetical protein